MGAQKVFRMAATVIAWFAIVLQYYLSMTRPGAEVLAVTVRYFSYFTMLSNILVALAMTTPWLAPGSRLDGFFTQPSVRTALAGYIIIVSMVYYAVLHKLWNPEGWHRVADTIEHCVTPSLYIGDWLIFVPRGKVLARSIPWWLIFPLAYGGWSLIHGAVTGYYPYPFLNVANLGYERVLINMMTLCMAFTLLSLLLVAIDRMLARIEAPRRS